MPPPTTMAAILDAMSNIYPVSSLDDVADLMEAGLAVGRPRSVARGTLDAASERCRLLARKPCESARTGAP
eukprot:7307536-Prymnesium_polylepis.1